MELAAGFDGAACAANAFGLIPARLEGLDGLRGCVSVTLCLGRRAGLLASSYG
jgi:hypothetical protein